MEGKNRESKRSVNNVIPIDGSKKTRVRGAKLPNGLTTKQEAFAHAVSEGHNLADAYREAYQPDSMTPEAIHVAASRVASLAKVSLRIEGIGLEKAARRRMLALSREDRLISQLENIAYRDSEAADTATMKALELLGRHLGIWQEKHIVETSERDPDQIKQELEKKLSALLG